MKQFGVMFRCLQFPSPCLFRRLEHTEQQAKRYRTRRSVGMGRREREGFSSRLGYLPVVSRRPSLVTYNYGLELPLLSRARLSRGL